LGKEKKGPNSSNYEKKLKILRSPHLDVEVMEVAQYKAIFSNKKFKKIQFDIINELINYSIMISNY
jgi:hypothetical protein